MRVNKTKNFTVMSNHHFKEKKMSLKAKGLLSLMLSLPDTWDYSISGLTTLSKDGKDSVMSALAELEKFGYLTRERITNDKGQFAGVEYNIYEEPQPKKPDAENQNEEKQNEGNANAENPEQLIYLPNKELKDKVFELLNTNDAELIASYREYIDMREEMKAPLTETALSKLIDRAKRLSKNNVSIEKVLLENAIINRWKNVYLPREEELEAIQEDTRNELRRMLGLD
jgi:hypothetical protein